MRLTTALGVLLLLPLGIAVPVARIADVPPPARVVAETVVGRGETLEAALLRSRLARAEAAAIVGALGGKVPLRRIQPGERLRVTWLQDGRLEEVVYHRTPVERYEIRPDAGPWRARRVTVPVETRVVEVAGILQGSLFESMDRLGETPVLTARFVTLFEWDFDFAADALPGDRFRLLVEKRLVGGEVIGYGDILIAQYRSAGREPLTAVAFEVAEGKVSYFDTAGRTVRKMFLRAPLDFTRITSGYSHARVHPILGGVRPHLAVDYAAPAGTPVRAVADGVVEAAGWNRGNGLSVTLGHARWYRTMYNHLSKVEVRAGQRVRQRQIIGRVGSTGLSTGPHLDYRVIRQGRFVNPLAERFVPGSPVPPARLQAFRQHLHRLLERLEQKAPFDASGTDGAT
jgi:murein DD-endopeptidase MepM/ murein hydrolase activator NlpD